MKKRTALIFTITMLLVAASSEAAEIKSVLLTDFDNSVLTVSGEAEEEIVSITILPEDTPIQGGQFGATDESNMSIQYAEVTDKNFNVSFNFPADSGMYDVYVSGNTTPFKFEFISKNFVLEFIDDLGNKKIPEEELFEKLSYFSSSIGVDVTFAKDKTTRDAVAKNMIYYADDIKTYGIEKIQIIVDQTKKELEFLSKLAETQTKTGVNTQLTEYATSAKIDLTTYNALSDYDKNNICTLYIGKKAESIYTFRTDFANDVTNAANTPDPKPSNGSGSGSGSGNGGGSSKKDSSGSKSLPAFTLSENTIPDGVRLFDKFEDVNDVSWAWDAILYLSDKGIINGTGGTSFSPNSNIKREQIAKIVTVAFGMLESDAKSDFDDIENDGWSEEYIASAKKYGIMTGISNTSFGYGQDVSRQDLCVTIYRAAKMAGLTFETAKDDFTDYDKVSDYAKEAVSYLAGGGIISGMGDGSFAPQKYATRAEAAKILYAVIGGSK